MSAIVVGPDSMIHDASASARDVYGLEVGTSFLEGGFEPHDERTFESCLSALTRQGPEQSRFELMQFFASSDHGILTTMITLLTPPMSTESRFLIVLTPRHDQVEAVTLLTSKFALTRTEDEIVTAFVRGNTLRQIAQDRGRSYTTIRNQFQTVLEKTGCRGQTDFLCLIINLSSLLHTTHCLQCPEIVTAQCNYVFPRRDGRKLEVQIDGARDGTPVLNFFSLFGPGTPEAITRELRARNVTLISPWRPGFGATSPPNSAASRGTCLAEDIAVVLDSLGLARCAWLARASASQSFYDMAIHLPERITHGVVVNGLVPRRYIAQTSVASKWTNALMSASFVSYPVARMILGAGERLIRTTDTAAFLQKMYGHSASDRAALATPEVAASIFAGVQHVVTQGLDAGVEDIVSGFTAWTTQFDKLRAPITLYHGREDPNVPFGSVAAFVQDHSAHLTLLPENGGGQLWYSHFSRILDLAIVK